MYSPINLCTIPYPCMYNTYVMVYAYNYAYIQSYLCFILNLIMATLIKVQEKCVLHRHTCKGGVCSNMNAYRVQYNVSLLFHLSHASKGFAGIYHPSHRVLIYLKVLTANIFKP